MRLQYLHTREQTISSAEYIFSAFLDIIRTYFIIMKFATKLAGKSIQWNSFFTGRCNRYSKLCFLLLFPLLVIISFVTQPAQYLPYTISLSTSTNSTFLPSTSKILLSTTAAFSSEIVVQMDDRVPSYKLATESGDKPYADGDRAQAQVLEELHLYETCQRDPSTIVVDVGAFLGMRKKGSI